MTRKEQERRLRIYSELCIGCAQAAPYAANKSHSVPYQKLDGTPAGFGPDPCRAWAVRVLHEQFDREDAEAGK